MSQEILNLMWQHTLTDRLKRKNVSSALHNFVQSQKILRQNSLKKSFLRKNLFRLPFRKKCILYMSQWFSEIRHFWKCLGNAMDKLNLVMVVRFKSWANFQYSPCCLEENDSRFKIGQNWLENNYPALLI